MIKPLQIFLLSGILIGVVYYWTSNLYRKNPPQARAAKTREEACDVTIAGLKDKCSGGLFDNNTCEFIPDGNGNLPWTNYTISGNASFEKTTYDHGGDAHILKINPGDGKDFVAGTYITFNTTPGKTYCASWRWGPNTDSDGTKNPFEKTMGLDPSGQNDPNASSIVWGSTITKTARQLDWDPVGVDVDYNADIKTVATSNTMTLFIKTHFNTNEDSHVQIDQVNVFDEGIKNSVTITAAPTATPANTTPTAVPTAVPTQQAGICPDISANQYETHETDAASVQNGLEPAVHPHKNINVYGYEVVATGKKALFDQAGLAQDVKAPQFSTVFSTATPAVVSLYKIYDWDSNQGKHLANDEVSMIGIGSNPGDVIQVPDAKFNLDTAKDEYGGPLAMVIYADDKSITLKYTLQDDIVSHYTTYIDNICVDPNLLNAYNTARAGEKWPGTTTSKKLPVLKGRQYIGTAKANEVRLAVRNSGDVVDPRWKNGWWRDTPGPIGGGGTTGTPFPTSYCGAVIKPDLTAADMPATYPGAITVKWSKPTGVAKYILKIDDMTSPWDDACMSSNVGDICENNLSSSSTSHQFNAEEGHSYHVILKSEDICGQASTVSEQILTASPPMSNTTCRIQGYRAVVGPIDQSTMKTPEGYFINSIDANKSESIWVSDTIKAAAISVAGGTPTVSYQHNPYSFVVPAGPTYTVSIASVPGYNIYAQSTTEQNPANQCNAFSYTNGQSVSVNCLPNQISKVWWYFVPNGVPTIALTPTSAPPTPTPTTIPEITYCKEIQVPSQDKATQFDVILLPDGYDVTEEALAIQDAQTAVTQSFNKTNLSDGIKSKINFWMNTNLTHSYDVKPGCGGGDAEHKVPCWNRDTAKEVQRLCEGDGYAIIKKATYQNLVDTWKVGGVGFIGAKEALLFSGQLISAAHEFCHAFASCADEYSYGKRSDPNSIPEYNCSREYSGSEAVLCPKWQADSLSGGCIANCTYDDWYRAAPMSTMFTGGEPLIYSDPAIKLWQNAFKIP